MRAGARRVVEGKQSGFEFGKAVATLGAGKTRREHLLLQAVALFAQCCDAHDAVTQSDGCFK